MTLEFNNGKIEIWTKDPVKGVYALSIKNPRTAWQINQILQHYPKSYKFRLGEEPVFIFTTAQIKTIASRSRSIRKVLTQIVPGMSRAA